MEQQPKEVYPGEQRAKEEIEGIQKVLDEKAAFMRRFDVKSEEPADDVPMHDIPEEHNVPPEEALRELEKQNP